MSRDGGSRELKFLAGKFCRDPISDQPPCKVPRGFNRVSMCVGLARPPTPNLITPLDPARIEGVSPSAEITRTPKAAR